MSAVFIAVPSTATAWMKASPSVPASARGRHHTCSGKIFMQKNQKPTLSSVRTPALGLLAALALAFGAPLHAADKSELLSGAREKVTEVKDSLSGKMSEAADSKTSALKEKKDALKKDGSKLQDKAASQKDKAKEATCAPKPTLYRAASAICCGSLPAICTATTPPSPSKSLRRKVFLVWRKLGSLVSISHTAHPAPNSRQIRRNGLSVMPAMGASAMGLSMK